MSRCKNCNKRKERSELRWVTDNYGIPYKLVCDDCYDAVTEEASAFVFDEAYAGERLDD